MLPVLLSKSTSLIEMPTSPRKYKAPPAALPDEKSDIDKFSNEIEEGDDAEVAAADTFANINL
jgi:hypothetical protein